MVKFSVLLTTLQTRFEVYFSASE